MDRTGLLFANADGRTRIPVATISLLILGPGTSVTHDAVRRVAEAGCLLTWTGEQTTRFYAHGLGETRSARNLIRQAKLVSDPEERLRVVRAMYAHRFEEPPPPTATLQQIRGMEGARVRAAYRNAAAEHGIAWDTRAWGADPANDALSTANYMLYGIVTSALIAAGYSPALGFIHTGKSLSFTYDIADLYKTQIVVPTAFEAVGQGLKPAGTEFRQHVRRALTDAKLLDRVLPDVHRLLWAETDAANADPWAMDEQHLTALWAPDQAAEAISGGINYTPA